ncbi:hypothetical protein RND71_035009 [Anisodus tanguticus]|uniref:Uncharacterized protein n=1 Tax=Anisodus tanguticus TaxID=243964 RepID=A0AAE1R4B1_9SOLA|nr:hypothetical protein RND71_035009 [Anisodus tanguticus]
MEQLTTEKKREVAVDKLQQRNHVFHYISNNRMSIQQYQLNAKLVWGYNCSSSNR